MASSAPSAPFSGPWYGPSNNVGARRYAGPAAVGIKRTLSRARPDLFEWKRFDNVYNRSLEDAIKKFQRAHKIAPASGQCGLPTFTALRRSKVPAGSPHAGEWAMDWVAVSAFEDAWDIAHPPKPPAVVAVRQSIAAYCVDMENYQAKWHYTQQRPYTGLGDEPEDGGYGDCSGYCIYAYGWARDHTGIHVPDPSGYNYAGYGNSQSIWLRNDDQIVRDGVYEVGDCALYGPSYRTKHISICRTRGTASEAIFSSFGSEAGPYPTRVKYRTDLLAVVRPDLVWK